MGCLDQPGALSDAELQAVSCERPRRKRGNSVFAFGSVHISQTCSSTSTCSKTFLYFLPVPLSPVADCILPSVVHVWPVEGTNCRGSCHHAISARRSLRRSRSNTSQIRHSSIPTSSVTSYCAPQAVHIIRSLLVLSTGCATSVFLRFASGELSNPAEPMMLRGVLRA